MHLRYRCHTSIQNDHDDIINKSNITFLRRFLAPLLSPLPYPKKKKWQAYLLCRVSSNELLDSTVFPTLCSLEFLLAVNLFLDILFVQVSMSVPHHGGPSENDGEDTPGHGPDTLGLPSELLPPRSLGFALEIRR